MLFFSRRFAAIFAVILAVQIFVSAFTGAYAQSAVTETQPAASQNKKIAYLTLDDGPSRATTAKNLDTLKKYGVKATFFVLPRNGFDDLYKRIVEEGHAIGNHSYSHDYNCIYSSAENFRKDVLKAENFIFEKTGYTTTAFRFPGGTMGRSKAVIRTRADILADMGYRYYDWDVSTADTDPNLKTYGSADHIVSLLVNNILNNTKNRKSLIILMHDTSRYSAKALPGIIEGLQEQGYEFGVLTNDGGWQYELNGNQEAVITSYTGNDSDVTVPPMLGGHNVTSIGSGVFTDDPVTSVNMPDSVVNIDSGAFRECRTLKAINFSEGNPVYKSVDGVVFDTMGAILVRYPTGKSGGYTVPEGVCTIGEGAFYGSGGLTQIILNESVSRIGSAAFESCEALTDAYFLGDKPEFGENVFQYTSEKFSVNYLESRTDSWKDYSDYPSKPFSDLPYFNDVASAAWYNQAVNFIAAREITSGTGNGRFSPDAKLTRGQFITLLMRAYGIEPDENPTDNFADAGSAYFTGYIAAAKRIGISGGVGNNMFAPEKEVTRQEMFTLLYNVLNTANQLPQGDSGKTLSDFDDAGQVGAWAVDAMTLLAETGVINGNGGKLSPGSTTSRAEMAQVLYNLLSK